jgi:hypothetical protein
VRTRVSDWHRVRLAVQRFDLPAAGTYVLQIAGLGSAVTYDDCAVVFTRPLPATFPLAIVAIVLSGFLIVGGIVVTALATAASFGWIRVE